MATTARLPSVSEPVASALSPITYWLRSRAYRVTYALALWAACFPSTSVAQISSAARTALARQGFGPQVFQDLDAARQMSSRAALDSWVACQGGIIRILFYPGAPSGQDENYLSLCVDKERALRASLDEDFGPVRARRVLSLLRAGVRFDIDQARTKGVGSKRAVTRSPDRPLRPPPAAPIAAAGRWFLQRDKPQSCSAILIDSSTASPSTFVVRADAIYTLAFPSPDLARTGPATSQREVIIYSGASQRTKIVEFSALRDLDPPATAMKLYPADLRLLSDASAIWVDGPARPGTTTRGRYYALPGISQALSQLASC